MSEDVFDEPVFEEPIFNDEPEFNDEPDFSEDFVMEDSYDEGFEMTM